MCLWNHLSKSIFHSVIYYCSTRNSGACIFYFKLNFSSSLCFSSIVNTFLSADLHVHHCVISKRHSKGRQPCLPMNKTAWFYFSNLNHFNCEAKPMETELYYFASISVYVEQDTVKNFNKWRLTIQTELPRWLIWPLSSEGYFLILNVIYVSYSIVFYLPFFSAWKNSFYLASIKCTLFVFLHEFF